MRQTLFRIADLDLFAIDWHGNVPNLGPGYALILWLVYGIYWWFRNVRSEGAPEGLVWQIVTWIVIACGILWVPTRFQGGIPVYGYGFFFLIGFVVGGYTATHRAERAGLNGEMLWDLGLWVFFSGVLGARTFYCIQYPERVFKDAQGQWLGGLDLITSFVNLKQGGLVFYGGMMLGIAGFIMFCRRRKVSPHFIADIAMPSVFVGLGFGRLGCLMNGCCYGDRCDLPWGIQFDQGSVPWDALVNRGFLRHTDPTTFTMHPTQVYSAINAFLLAWLTATYFKSRPRDGSVVALGMLIYPITRFTIEIIRGDEIGRFGTDLTISQWVSIGLFTCGVVYAVYLHFVATPRLTVPSGKALAESPSR